MSQDNVPFQIRDDREEHLNFATHAFGAALFLSAAFYLIPRIWDRPSVVFASASLFALMLIVVYTCSALSHYFHNSKFRMLFRKLDQAFIFLLIVATYTPYSVKFLQHTWWWVLLGAMWLIAIGGFISKLFFARRIEGAEIWIYLILGWMPALGGMPFSNSIPATAIWSIVGGGLFYTVGTLFLFNDYKCWYFHGIWHLFVIAGSAVHFIGVLVCV